MTRPQSAIAATGLRKSFGDHLVLDGIDLDVAEGTIFALLGPNGAGKTTIVQILSTLIGADAGEIRVAGNDPARDPDAVRAAIGVTGHRLPRRADHRPGPAQPAHDVADRPRPRGRRRDGLPDDAAPRRS
jgi:ABC-type molybdenum transport system ATPase subunit/photorepair protein PhrA